MNSEKRGGFVSLFFQVYSKCRSAFSITLIFLSFICSLFYSLFETLSLGLIIPLLESVLNNGSLPKFGGADVLLRNIGLNSTVKLVFFFAFLILVAVLLKNLFGYLSSILVIQVRQNVEKELRVRIMQNFLKHDFLFFEKNKVGDLNYDIELSSSFSQVISTLHLIVQKVFTCIAYLAVMFYISWKISLFMIVVLPVVYVLSRLIKSGLEGASKSQVDSNSRLASRTYEILSCIGLIKSYGTEEKEFKEFSKLTYENKDAMINLDKRVALIPVIQEPIIVLAVMIIAAVSYVLFIGNVEGAIAGFMTYFVVLKRFENIMQVAVSEIFTINKFNAQMEKIILSFKVLPWMIIKSGRKKFAGIKRSIDFRNICFKYGEDDDYVLNNINLNIKKGTTVALVGHSGSGKTTFVSLIPRIFDYYEGGIFIDGVSLKKFDIKSLRKNIGIVSQNVVLLNRTIRDNLCYGLDKKVSNKIIVSAAKKAGIYDFINSLPDKFETLLDENGVNLSGGERQRLSIARAILRNPSLLIFDEATSALDTDTEREIQHALHKEFKRKTVFMIAHRLSTVEHADLIVVFENGSMTEQGTFRQLLRKKGRFYHYWKIQTEL